MTLKSLLFARRIATKLLASVPLLMVSSLPNLALVTSTVLISQPMVAQTGMISEITPRQETTPRTKSATALTARTIPARRDRIGGGLTNGLHYWGLANKSLDRRG